MWPDRILYWSGNNPSNTQIFNVRPDEYRSFESFRTSDHKPVRGKFSIKVYKEYTEEDRVEFSKIEGWYCDPDTRPLIR